MQCLLLFLSMLLLMATIALPFQQRATLKQAEARWHADDVDGAKRAVDDVRQTWPQVYAERASALCGDITLTQARRLLDSATPDFGGAVGLLRAMETRCGASGREDDAAHLLDTTAFRHLDHATTRCRQRDYAGAQAAFQQIALLPYPERGLTQAQDEVAWCQLAHATTLARQQRFEAAFELLHRLLTAAPVFVREAALKQVPTVVQEELDYWQARLQFAQLFKQFTQRQRTFGDYPDTADFFTQVGRQLELQVFGVRFDQQCRMTLPPPRRTAGKRGKPLPQGPLPGAITVLPASLATLPADAGTANLVLQNDTPHPLRILLRGQEQRDVVLAPRATQALTLEPAEYLVGIYAPGNCRVKSERTAWTVREKAPYSVRFYERQT